MDAKHPHFMASVLLIEIKEQVSKAKEDLDQNSPHTAISRMRISMQKLADAMEELYTKDAK